MDFTIIDVILLVLFVIFISIFLYRRRKNLKREGLLFLYKTSLGVKIINRVGEKHKKLLNFLSYVSIGLGFVLMGAMLYLFGKLVWMYIFQGELVKMVKIPPIMPLLPYLPQIFKLNFLPPFYFIYWIIIIAIVAISHEFAHGIFAVNKKVKIKSTGFGFFPFFLPIFLAAFVELDEKRMEKKKILPQMAILSAGTFANLIIALLSLAILILFFSLAYAPAGVTFDAYTYSAVGISAITSVNNISVENVTYEKVLNLINGTNISEIGAGGKEYLLTTEFLESQTNNQNYIFVYEDAPAINAGLGSTILKMNNIEINSKEKLASELLKYSPREKITVTTLYGDAFKDYEIVLGENPDNKSAPYLGIGFLTKESSGIFNKVVKVFSSFRNPNIYYKANFGAAEFIYNLLWWLVLISFSVALMNMLPVGIFDGGRFFYLAMLALTKSKEKSKKIFSIITYIFLALLAVILVFWAIRMFK